VCVEGVLTIPSDIGVADVFVVKFRRHTGDSKRPNRCLDRESANQGFSYLAAELQGGMVFADLEQDSVCRLDGVTGSASPAERQTAALEFQPSRSWVGDRLWN
jgi:hypothetical protein